MIVPRSSKFTIQVVEGKIYPTVGALWLKWHQDPPSRYDYTRVRNWQDRAGKANPVDKGDGAERMENRKGPWNWIWGCEEHPKKGGFYTKELLHDTYFA